MKKVGLFCLALVLALGTLGISYAAWTDTVYMEQTVETGTVKIGIGELILLLSWDEKDIADISGYLDEEVGEKWSEPDQKWIPYYKKAYVTVDNAYPGIKAHVTYTIGCFGTIPVIISDIDFEVYDEASNLLAFEWVVPPPDGNAWGKVFDERGDPAGHIMNILLVNSIGEQLHYCESAKSEWDVVFLQPLKQDHTYTIIATVTAIQYNKYVP
jgi:hypothetical protein